MDFGIRSVPPCSDCVDGYCTMNCGPVGTKIKTVHCFPPIPVRKFDWCAFYDGLEEDGNYGWGETEVAAIEDLLQQAEES